MNLKDSTCTGFLVLLIAVAILVSVSGCGTLLNGSVPVEQRGEVDGVALILNLLFFIPGIFIDMLTGGFWERKIPPAPEKKTP